MILFFTILIICSTSITALIYLYHRSKSRTINFYFYSGLAYLFMGVPILVSYVAFVGIPMTLIGILFLSIGNSINKSKTDNDDFDLENLNGFLKFIYKYRWIRFLVLFPLVLLFMFLIYWEAPYAKILIPQGYTGRVVILHDCLNGKDTEKEGWNKRVYKVDSEGLLYSKSYFHGNFDHNRLEFYYYDEKDHLYELEYYKGGFYSERIGIKWSSPKVYHGFLRNPDSSKISPFFNFIVETEVFQPDNYKQKEIPKWEDNIRKCNE